MSGDVWKARAEKARRDLIAAEVALRTAGDPAAAHAAHMASHHAIGEECGPTPPAAYETRYLAALEQVGLLLDEAAENAEDPEQTLDRVTDLVLAAQAPNEAGKSERDEQQLGDGGTCPRCTGPDSIEQKRNAEMWAEYPDAPAPPCPACGRYEWPASREMVS